MQKISKMYQLSGGCDWHHKCGDCSWCIKVEENDHFKACLRHPKQPKEWNEDWMACKWFSKHQILHQMTVEEYLGGINGSIS